MPLLTTGIYKIKNVPANKYVTLCSKLNDLVASEHVDRNHEEDKWQINIYVDNRCTIQNCAHKSFAGRPQDSVSHVSGKERSDFWKFKELDRGIAIYTPNADERYWCFEKNRFNMQVILREEPPESTYYQWIFEQWVCQRQEIQVIPSNGDDRTPTTIPLPTITPTNMDLIESEVFGGNEPSFEKFHDIDELVKISPISRIVRIKVVFYTVIYQISVTYQLALGEEITRHPHSCPNFPEMQSHTIDFSDGEVLVEVNGFVKGVIFEMSFVILNTRTNAKRVDGPFGNGHAVDWLPKDCIGNRFIFRMDGRHIIAFGGRYDPVNPCRLTGLTFIHCPL